MNKFSLAIYTEETTVFEGEVESIRAPGAAGYLGVWANHAPLLTSLIAGALDVRVTRDEERHWDLTGGFLEVLHNRAVVLADAVKETAGGAPGA